MTDYTELKAKLQSEFARNGGQGAYAWGARELCGKASDAITALEARVAELEADLARWQDAAQYPR